MTHPERLNDLWRDLANEDRDDRGSLVDTLSAVRAERRRRVVRGTLALATAVVVPLLLGFAGWRLLTTPAKQNGSAEVVKNADPSPEPAETKRPRGRLVIVDVPSPPPPEWHVEQLTDEQLLAALPVPAKLVETATGKELVFLKGDEKAPTEDVSPRRLPRVEASGARHQASGRTG